MSVYLDIQWKLITSIYDVCWSYRRFCEWYFIVFIAIIRALVGINRPVCQLNGHIATTVHDVSRISVQKESRKTMFMFTIWRRKNGQSLYHLSGAFQMNVISSRIILLCCALVLFLFWFDVVCLPWFSATCSDSVLISVVIVHRMLAHCYDIAITIIRAIHSVRISYTRELSKYAAENFLRTMNSDQVQCAWIVCTNYCCWEFAELLKIRRIMKK